MKKISFRNTIAIYYIIYVDKMDVWEVLWIIAPFEAAEEVVSNLRCVWRVSALVKICGNDDSCGSSGD